MNREDIDHNRAVLLDKLNRTFQLLHNAQQAKSEAAQAETTHRAELERIMKQLDELNALTPA